MYKKNYTSLQKTIGTKIFLRYYYTKSIRSIESRRHPNKPRNIIINRAISNMPQSLRSVTSSKRPLNRGEERLLGILHHLRDLKEAWEGKISSETTIKDLRQEIEKIENIIEEITKRSSDRKLTFGEAFQKSKSTFLAAGAATSIVLGISMGTNNDTKEAAPLFYIIGAGAGITALIRTKGSIRKSEETLRTRKTKLDNLNEQLSTNRRKYSELSKQLRANTTNLPKVTFGTALLPLTKAQILNKSFLINESKLIKPTELQTIVLRDLSKESAEILSLTRKVNNVPVLLTPSDESISESRSNM